MLSYQIHSYICVTLIKLDNYIIYIIYILIYVVCLGYPLLKEKVISITMELLTSPSTKHLLDQGHFLLSLCLLKMRSLAWSSKLTSDRLKKSLIYLKK